MTVVLGDIVVGLSVCTTVIVDKTHRCHISTAIDILVHRSTRDIDKGVSRYATCPLHGRKGIINGGDIVITSGSDSRWRLVITSIATAKDVAVDDRTIFWSGVRFYIHSSLVTYNTVFTTTIDIVINCATTDVNLCQFHYSQLRPQWIQVTIKQRDTTHAATEYITTNRVRIFISCSRSTDSTASDINGDMAIGWVAISSCFIFQLTIRITSWFMVQIYTYRCQTTTAIYGAQHRTSANSHRHITTYGTCQQAFTRVTTTTTEYVTIYIRSTGGSNSAIVNLYIGIS